MDTQPIAKWSWNEHMNRNIEESLSELEREAHIRIRLYDRWISEGKLTRVDAWDRAERLISSIAHLRTYADLSAKEAF